MIDLEKALKIPALMSEGEMLTLAGLAADRKRIVEIGSWQGASARAMVDNFSGVIYCVDTWADDAYGSAPAEQTSGKDWLWQAFQRNHSDTLAEGRVIPYRMPSAQAVAELRDMRFDMIFIDADHSYMGVRFDIHWWRPLLAEGGILCGHDLYPPNSHHPGVRQAVEEMIPKFRSEGTIWIAETPDA